MLGLRLEEGVSLDDLAARTGLDPRALFGPLLRRLAGAGLVELDGDRFRLTEDGIPVADAVIAEFLAPA